MFILSLEVLELVRLSPTCTCIDPARFSPPEAVVDAFGSPRFLSNLPPGVVEVEVVSLTFDVPLLDGAVKLRLTPLAPPGDNISSSPGERGAKSSTVVSAGGRYTHQGGRAQSVDRVHEGGEKEKDRKKYTSGTF